MLFSFISGWSDLLRCPLCIFLCCCRDGTAAAATKADMTYCNNFVSGIMIWCQRKSFFFKSLILHEIMKFLKISFFCTENFWPKISAAILIWGYDSTWKLKILYTNYLTLQILQVAQRRILTIAPKFIYIFPSPSQ